MAKARFKRRLIGYEIEQSVHHYSDLRDDLYDEAVAASRDLGNDVAQKSEYFVTPRGALLAIVEDGRQFAYNQKLGKWLPLLTAA